MEEVGAEVEVDANAEAPLDGFAVGVANVGRLAEVEQAALREEAAADRQAVERILAQNMGALRSVHTVKAGYAGFSRV